jgi:S-formylglutathione hydrolase
MGYSRIVRTLRDKQSDPYMTLCSSPTTAVARVTFFFFHRLRTVALIAVLAGPASAQFGGVIHRDVVPAPSLRHNLLGDPAERPMSVYLPPSYSTSPHRRYPVLYFLHGFDADDRVIINGAYQNLDIRISMDSLIRLGRAKEMIVVMPSARNAYNGSFYTNSPVTGNWEDFVARDLVRYIDGNYRTIRDRTARGITGHSMGGYGALYVAMRHPDTFSAVYAMSAYGLGFDVAPTDPAYERLWQTVLSLSSRKALSRAGFQAQLLVARAAARSPNRLNPPLYVDLPYRYVDGSLVPVSLVTARWRTTPLSMARSHVQSLRRLRIAVDAGAQDDFLDIPVRAQALDSALTVLQVPHEFELYQGTHGNRIRERIEKKVIPFFSRNLARAR